MTITYTDNTVRIESNIISNKFYLHTLVNKQTNLLEKSNITISYSDFTLLTDGWREVKEYILPDQNTHVSGEYYIYNNNIYRSTGISGELISIANFITLDLTNTNVIVNTYNLLLTFYLNSKYLDLIKAIIYAGMNSCNVSKQESMTRDVLMMGLELINKLIYTNRFAEAQRLLDDITPCSINTNLNCGCNG